MATRNDLPQWVIEALRTHNGSASLIEVSKYVWENYEGELRRSGNLFYTWQYDVRWAADKLRREGKMKAANLSGKGIWKLA